MISPSNINLPTVVVDDASIEIDQEAAAPQPNRILATDVNAVLFGASNQELIQEAIEIANNDPVGYNLEPGPQH